MPERSLPGEFTKGIIEQNPLLILMVGLCPSLAITTEIKNAVAMGAAVIVVLFCSNLIISIFRKVIPAEVRIPCFIVIIASFVTMVDIIFKAYLPPAINAQLGIFIPLIVVNCIILYRAEAFASKTGIARSALDGLGMGVGFTCAIVLIATIREFLGAGTIWGYTWMPAASPFEYVPAPIFGMAPGAFIVLGLVLGLMNRLQGRKA
jgi:electron transport complex protein RnfE